ncbi:MAG: FHA domain-containing protein [Acidobacteria bacterium]|nr:FHA domain-containing protein [Acidobacteriota bacterium]
MGRRARNVKRRGRWRRPLRGSPGGAALVACLLTAGPAATANPTESFIFLLDCSGSIRPPDRDRALRLADRFAGDHPGAEIAVDIFGDRVATLLDFGSDRSISELRFDAARFRRRTVLYDAIFDASQRLADRQTARRAILLFTDGKDEGSDLVLEDAVRTCLEKQIPVITVAIGYKISDKPMRRISKLTGGFYAVLQSDKSTAPLLAEIDRRLPAPSPAPQPAAQPTPERSPGSGAPAVEKRPQAALPEDVQRERAPIFTYVVAGIIGLVAAGAMIVLLVVMRRRREPTRICSTCGQPIESYFSDCPNCRPVAPPETVPVEVAAASGEEEPPPLPDAEYPAHNESKMDESTVVMLETPVLVVKRGKNLGAVYPVPWCGMVNIGRSRSNNIVVDDRTASSEHCRLKHDGERFLLYDLKSTNGSFLNDRKVTQAYVKDGDTLQVGETQLMFKVQRLSS